MANQYTALPIPDGVEELYKQGLTQKEIGDKFGVSQKMVFGWFKKLGIKSRIASKRNQWGELNHMWKGDEATYQAKHHWIEKQQGKPNKCQHCGITTGIIEWANIGHKYKRDIKDWVRLCRKHHRQMDKGNLDILNSLRG